MAQQVLYCVDTDTTGFVWDKEGKARRNTFALERYTVKVLSDSKRLITRTGDPRGDAEYTCKQPYPRAQPEWIECDYSSGGNEPWLFYRNRYTRAYLAGGSPTNSPLDPNIWIAYGTCTGF
jgi:hypothetical protein